MKHYLLVYGKDLGKREEIKACLESLPQVNSWRFEMPNSFFIRSELDAKELGDVIQACRNVENPRYFLVEIPPQDPKRSWGWLVADSWLFMGREPKSKS